VIDKNSSCSPWLDIIELIQAQDADVVDSDGKLVNEHFLQLVEEYQNAHPDRPVGICWRWVLGVKEGSTDILLLTQALPCDLDDIEVNYRYIFSNMHSIATIPQNS